MQNSNILNFKISNNIKKYIPEDIVININESFILLFDKLEEDIYNLGNSLIIKQPIFYLFDNADLNSDIGSKQNTMKKFIDILDLDRIFELNNNNITFLGVNDHSTIFYKFKYNNRKYIYYSNSGLGIENQLNDIHNKITACKIFYFHDDNESVYNDIIECIKSFIILIEKFDIFYSKIDSSWDSYKYKNFLNIEDFKIFVNFCIYSLKEHKIQYIIYVLLNYICSNNNINLQECTINHVLFEKDDENYKENIKYLYIDKKTEQKFTSTELIDNCYNKYNETIYTNIINKQVDKKNDFSNFINEINFKLDEIKKESSTIEYKLNNSFKLVYNNNGLYNQYQNSGSCTFYSYYNLGINMKILELFKNNDYSLEIKVNNFIDTFINIHYKILYLFCLSNDTKYFSSEKLKTKLYLENFHNIKYINKLIVDNKLVNELIKIYSSDTFLFNPNKLFIDKLLDYKNNNIEFSYLSKIIKKDNKILSIFNELNNYINLILYNLREQKFNFYSNVNSSPFYKNIPKNIKIYFDKIESDLLKKDNIFFEGMQLVTQKLIFLDNLYIYIYIYYIFTNTCNRISFGNSI
jgi:hypothetical protein